jgi:hypothetical protein
MVSILFDSLVRVMVDVEVSQAAKDVHSSQGMLVDLFSRIERFFKRLESYTSVPPTTTMTSIIVEIMVEVLSVLGTATKEIKQRRSSEPILIYSSLPTYFSSRKIYEETIGKE